MIINKSLSGIYYILLCIMLLTNCTSFEFRPRKTVKIVSDEYETTIKILGIEHQIGKGFSHHFIRTFYSPEYISHQLYVSYYHGVGWDNYYTAYLKGGIALNVVDIDSDVDCSGYGCTYHETFGIDIPDSLIQTGIGFTIKVKGKSGKELILSISDKQVSEQLKALNQLL